MLTEFINKIIFRLIFICAIGLGLLTSVSATNLSSTPPKTINRLIVFGDSLSDNGNLYTLTIELHDIDPKIPVIPNPTLYWNGRFSNGPVWNEFLANMLHFTGDSIDPEIRDSDQYQNYAYSGAWAEKDQTDAANYTLNNVRHNFPPPLGAQVDQYIQATQAEHPETYQEAIANDLIFLWIGGNDYLNQAIDGPPIARDPQVSTEAVIQAIHTNIEKLITAGTRHLVIFGLPDLSKIPDVALRDPNHLNLVLKFAQMSRLHNEKLKQLLAELQARHPEVGLMFLDTDEFFMHQFEQSYIRQKQYALLHNGSFQRLDIPCILEPTDPTPDFVNLHLTHTLAFAAIKTFNPALPFQHCDSHTTNDQKSLFDYGQFYEAGGIFFDHIHPTTQLHAHMALKVCQLLESKGYYFYQPDTASFVKLSCEQYDLKGLIHSIINPDFPTLEN